MDRQAPHGLVRASSGASPTKVRVWDAPTRVVHWLVVALVATSWWTAENGELQVHRYSGYALLGLLVFRFYWAFVGGATARLFSRLRGPRALIAYAKGLASRQSSREGGEIGLNPLGAWSALALLVLLSAQTGLGLFAVDVDGIESGPLSHLVSFEVGRSFAAWHEKCFDALLAFLTAHIGAVLFHVFYKRDNLVAPMISGVRLASHDAGPATDAVSWRRTAVGVALAALATWAGAAGFWF
jgi:cytochrome b